MSGAEERHSWRSWPPLSYILAASLVVLAAWALGSFISAARALFFFTFLAILIAAILKILIDFMSRRLPRWAATMATLALLLGLLLLLGWLVVPVLFKQGSSLVAQIPGALDAVQRWQTSLLKGTALAGAGGLSTSLLDMLKDQIDALLRGAVPLAIDAFSVLAGAVLFVALAFFLAHRPHIYVEGAVRLLPRRYRPTAGELIHRLGATIQSWMLGTLFSMTVVSVLTGLGLLLVGQDHWFMLGALMFFGEFIPYLGPVLGALPGVVISFAASPKQGLLVLLVYVAVQQIEGNLLTPLVMRRAVRLAPALLLVWQAMALAAFGLMGIVVATPLLACIKVAVEKLYIERKAEAQGLSE